MADIRGALAYLRNSLFPQKFISPVSDAPDIISPLGPTATPTPTPVPAPPRLATEQYQVSGNFDIPKRPEWLEKLIWDYFPDTATKAAVMLGTENPSYNPNAYNFNRDQSGDYGLAQINSNTMQDYINRKPNTMKKLGISSVNDLKDIYKNLALAALIADTQGWGAWYGPGNKGYDIAGR